ncbi:dystonin isoform X8 [Denticeps clupeoides]|uniref:dystonin isoform X8 n=1 Tax=Denticeps clupeoides TaxID=299321 RepID=UPI0010A41E67|nr:dystonin isoform X8 [Denticeps clupeoides]
MIAAAFLVLLRPLSLQCVLVLLLLLLGTVATILFFCCWHRRLRSGKHPMKAVFSGRPRSREAGFRTHHFRSECFRHSPCHARRLARGRVSEEAKPPVGVPESDPDSTPTARRRRVKKRVAPEFYQSVQVTPTRKISSGSGNASLRCSMSSSADFSDEDDCSPRSGAVSPSPGDTLPWNLPRHERSKRKIQGGSILDPAERAVLRIADERDRVQKKTFTKWINQHLLKVRKHVNDLYEDLRDGHNLISLLEVLSGESLPREKGRMRFHRLQNVQIALDYLKRRQVKLVNIRNDDITDGNPKLTLGLIWTIILHFQISEIHVTGESEDMTAKERLLLWSQQMTEGYVGVRCDNFTTSWRDGRLFNAIIHKYRPDLVDMSRVSTQASRSNLEQAFGVAELLGVARLLDPEDMDVQSPDEKSVITYVSTLYDVFPKVPEGGEGIGANDVDIKWVEYQNMVMYLSQWIKHNVSIMSDRTFPSNPAELKALFAQYQHFKEREIPVKENEKTKIKQLYKMLEVWIEFGRIHLPQGYHPNDVEKEWGKLIVAMLEREKSLRPEVDRLEMLQQIANRVQRDCVAGEDKLALARASLQSDAKRLESGIQFQNEAEIAGFLLDCENFLRQQVVDIQFLLDGKFYLADQLAQRVFRLREDLLALRTECSSVYNKGRSLSTEQTKRMISGITHSLNSGFSQNIDAGLTPVLTPGGLVPSRPTYTSSLTPCLAPAVPPGLQPAPVPGYMDGGGGRMDQGALQHLTLIKIRKPMLKSSMVDPSLTEDEVNMNHVQDLLNWVEEMQVQLDRAEWGTDLPTVESHLDNHKTVHRAIEEFQMSLKEAKISEIQMAQPLKHSYTEKLKRLENLYGKLLSCSRERQKNLESLHDFVSRATQELIWLNEKEEEEVAFDWSDRNSNISKKKEYHVDLMRELDDKEEAIKSVQDKAEILLMENHPARLTIEAFKAAMQTQWSWILQLCFCVEQHLKENAVYFEFFNDAKEAADYLKNLQDAIQRKYGCDRTSSLHRLEDLIQESMDEKEQLLHYRSSVAGLVRRAKDIVQLKPRSPDSPIRTSIPVKAICDYRQIEITINKDDECVLASNSHRAKWKVISPAGNEAMVPSVCFSVPPPNKEAVEMSSKIEQSYQNVLALWHRSHVNMKSVVSWHYLMADIHAVRKSNVASIKTMLPGEHQQVLSNLQSHFGEFLEDSEESEVFTVADCAQLEREVLACREYYEELLKSAEREEQEESVYNLFMSEIRNFRMRLEGHEEQLIRHIRTPLDRDDLQQSLHRINEQEKKKTELDHLRDDMETMREKCEAFLRQAASSPSVPTLSSELQILVQSMGQVYSMCSIYLEKLKTVSVVVKHSQSAEALVKLYEAKLSEEDAVIADIKSIESVMSTLKQWRSEIDEKRGVFHDLEDELQKGRLISERMFKTHNERDFDLDWHKEKADQLGERWHNVHSQIENRLRDLEGIGKSLRYYRDAYCSLEEWATEMETNQLAMQENQPDESKALAELLNKQKVLVSEMEMKQCKIDECQKYSEQYSARVKDYELQLMTYRAMVDSQHKSPIKRRRMQSSSDAIIQEFMDLRTRYTALVTLMTQYVKFASETLKRTEEEEKSIEEEKKEQGDKVSKLLNWMSNVKVNQGKDAKAGKDPKTSSESSYNAKVSIEELVTKKEQMAEALRSTQMMLTKHSDKMTEEERQETKEHLSALQQAYSELSRQCVDQTPPSPDQEFRTIEGILEVGSGAVLSVCHAVRSGLIDHTTGMCFLEAQLITSGLILPKFPTYLDLEDAFLHQLVDEATYTHLQDLSRAYKVLQTPKYASHLLPVVAALKDGAISEQMGIKMVEMQLATGGLRVTHSDAAVSLEKAFHSGLIPPEIFVKVLEKQNSSKNLIDPSTAEKVSLIQLVQRSLVDEETGLRVLSVKPGKNGNISLTSGREMSILKAAHEGFIDQETMLRLLGAQLFAGGIVDPKTGHRLTVEEALSGGLIDPDTASGILSLQLHNGGIVESRSGRRLTVDEAVQCNLISSSTALLVLEKQKSFMGLLWPHNGEILTVSSSLDHEIITDQLASKLLFNRHKMAAFYIPESSEVVYMDSAVRCGFIDECTADILKTLEIPDAFPDIDELNDKFSSWLVWRELRLHNSPQNPETDEQTIITPTPSEARQLFISYLIMNSYMDPDSGQRLLVFDGQLNKMAKLFIEHSAKCESSGQSEPPPLFTDISLDDDVSEHLCGAHRKTMEEDSGAEVSMSIHPELLNTANETNSSQLSLSTLCTLMEHDKALPFETEVYESLHVTEEIKRARVMHSFFHANLEQSTHHSSTDEEVSGNIESSNSVLSCSHRNRVLEEILEESCESDSTEGEAQGDGLSENGRPTDLKSPDNAELEKADAASSAWSIPGNKESICDIKLTLSGGCECLYTEVVRDDNNEKDYAVHLWKSQVEEGGILDVASGKRYDLNAALEKGLVDEEKVFGVLALQSHNNEAAGNPNATMSILKGAVSKGSMSCQVALEIMKQDKVLCGIYESECGEALETGLITDCVANETLNIEPVRNEVFDSHGNCGCSANDARALSSPCHIDQVAQKTPVQLETANGSCEPSLPINPTTNKELAVDIVSKQDGESEDANLRVFPQKTLNTSCQSQEVGPKLAVRAGDDLKIPSEPSAVIISSPNKLPCQGTTVNLTVNPVESESGVSCSTEASLDERRAETFKNSDRPSSPILDDLQQTLDAPWPKALPESPESSISEPSQKDPNPLPVLDGFQTEGVPQGEHQLPSSLVTDSSNKMAKHVDTVSNFSASCGRECAGTERHELGPGFSGVDLLEDSLRTKTDVSLASDKWLDVTLGHEIQPEGSTLQVKLPGYSVVHGTCSVTMTRSKEDEAGSVGLGAKTSSAAASLQTESKAATRSLAENLQSAASLPNPEQNQGPDGMQDWSNTGDKHDDDLHPAAATGNCTSSSSSSILRNALTFCLNELVKMKVQGADPDDPRKDERQAADDIIAIIRKLSPSSTENSTGGKSVVHSPDLLLDLEKVKEPEGGQCGRKDLERLPADVAMAHAQLLQVIQSLSSNEDPNVLMDAVGRLNDTVENTTGRGSAPADAAESVRHPDKSAHETHVRTFQGADVSEKAKVKMYSTQSYLECIGRLQDHYDVLEDIKNDLQNRGPLSNNVDELHSQLEESQSLESQLLALAGVLTADLEIAEKLLQSANGHIPMQIHQDLASVFIDLQPAFNGVYQMSAEKHKFILQAIEKEKSNLESSYQGLLCSLDKVSESVNDTSEVVCKLGTMDTDNLDAIKSIVQQNKDIEKNVTTSQQQLEDLAFSIQHFICDHAQFLSPAQSRHLLKSLSDTQVTCKELTERVSAHRHNLDLQMEILEEESQHKSVLDKQSEFSARLQELYDNLTLTEDRLTGHQQQDLTSGSVGDLQHYQKEHQDLQKEIQTNASALNEFMSSSKKFLEENRDKLSQEQTAAIENKLEEAKNKVNRLNQRAEESVKNLEKVVTTAIKEETKKVAAVEQFEESKSKIEGLLNWITDIGKGKEMGGTLESEVSNENGNTAMDTSADDANGNDLDATDNKAVMSPGAKDSSHADLDEQYERVKAHHQEILSQQQDLIIATQSAQALLDRQAQVLSPGEKEKLQRDIHDLSKRYSASLSQAEQQMKQLQSVQEELRKFQGDTNEFDAWLQQAQGEMKDLGTAVGELDSLTSKLQRQKSFSEDVISHKGDLRFVTISGQKVLDAARACNHNGPRGKDMLLEVDMSRTCASVQEKLDSAASHYKELYSQCNQLGTNLKGVVDKYKKYEEATGGLLKWLDDSEEEARRQQAEAIAADPQTLQKQLEDTKALQGQTTGRQAAVETLRKSADALIAAEGNLLTNQDEIQETADDIVERYDNLSKSVSNRSEKLQVTLTRSLSVQDGLDEMMNWMEKVEGSIAEKGKVSLESAVIGDVLSKETALEQDMLSRQSSISAMKAKLKTFVETADPTAAVLLQSKMDVLSQRFSDACSRHKQKVSDLEHLKEKVEQFEKTSEKVQQFVLKRSQTLSEADGPSSNVNELSQMLQNANLELAEHAKDIEILQKLSKDLVNLNPEGSAAQIRGKMETLSNTFNAFKDTVKAKEEEVSSCQDQLAEFRTAAGALMRWLEETTASVPAVRPNCGEQSLGADLLKVTAQLNEWTSKAEAVQDINSKASALCSLISVLVSPAKTKVRRKSGSVVTNGSGPGTHAYLTNKELVGVEQDVARVSMGYEGLGELLKGRESELSDLFRKLREAGEEADSMLQWLASMKKTARSWKAGPAGKDSVKIQMEQQKAFEDDLKQKQGQLQQLREKLLRLIEEQPDSPEAEKWKQMLAQIDAVWEDISGSLEDRKQHLEESSRMLEVFQSTEPQLNQWLQEKELMMSVLGPLSMDPNMLNTQKQQVQILLNEFDSRKPQFEQLKEAATAILSSTGQQDPLVGSMEERLNAVDQKWQALTGQLCQRAGLIDQAAGKTSQYQEMLWSISESTSALESQLSSQQALSSQPEEVKKQLEATNDILTQLREERKRLKEAEALCGELSAMVSEDYLKADLSKQLEGVIKPFKQLEDKAGTRINQLNSAFASSQQFHKMSKDFQAWLDENLNRHAGPRPVSAKVEVLQQSINEQTSMQKVLSEQEESYKTIAREGEALLHTTEGAEKVALQGQLSVLRSDWEEVKKGSTERAEKLQGALNVARKYKEHAEKLSTWLQESEAGGNSVRLSVNHPELDSALSQVKAIQKDVDKHQGQVAQLNTTAESLLDMATVDKEAIREERASIEKRVEKLSEGLQNKKDLLEKISQRLKEFSDTQKEAKGQLDGARKQLDNHAALGVQAYSTKNLSNMKAQQKSLVNVQNQVEHLKSLAKGLVVDVPDADDVTDLLLQADCLEKEHGSVSKEVEETCSALEGKLQGIGQFQNSIREMFTCFAELDDELDGMALIARDLGALRLQKDSIKSFISKLQDLASNTDSARDTCKSMLETEASPDLLGLKRDLEALNKQCGKLMDRARGREEQVEGTLGRLEDLYQKLKEFSGQLKRAEEQEESQGPVGMETEVISQQLEAFKVFQKDVIETLQTQLQDLNWVGQGLIQNAAKGTSTKSLEDDLEDANTQYNTLNKKIAERSAQLHEALLHCGRFQDALESLLSWLTDTEELVASQKSPSAEFKVVKAQIQEQKLLQRLLDERRPTVELIKKEGGKVSALAESVDKEKIRKQIDGLGQRWDTLLKKAESRHKQLESILVVAQQFHETLEPLVEWLTATEKRLANSEPIGTQTSKLEEQISQHKTFEEEIMRHSKDLYQAMSLGQSLRAVSSLDDKELLQSRLDATQAGYIELQERSRRRAELLQQALANAQLFGEDEVALLNWLSEVHSRLSEVSVQDYQPEVLRKQHEEQLTLREEIRLKKQNVDLAIFNGMELLKQTTGDEVVVIQGKLDGIKSRYADINTMSGDVSKSLEQALTLATRLQLTHEDLCSWLEKVEHQLAVFGAQEPVGEQLTQVQDKQKALLKEVEERRSQVDSLNTVSNSLLELVPWRAREGLDKMITEDNERYKFATDSITQRVEAINAAILKSQQFEQAADSELTWLTDAENKLQTLGEIRLEQDQTTAQLQAQKGFSMDIMRHKDSVDDIVKTGETIMRSKNEVEKEVLKAKIQELLDKYNVVSQLNSERCLQLERAQSLATQFWETYEELWPWLQETRANFTQLPQPAIEYEVLRQQQEELRQMRELIAEHKPHIDKMNKTGPQLLELSPVEGLPIREKYTTTDKIYAQLKADVKQRAGALDEAMSKCTQFHDKIDPMMEALERIAERLRQPPSISVEVEKIKEQISENKAVTMDLEKLLPSYDTLRQRGEEMIARSEGADKDISAKAVQDKLDQMVFTWNDIQALLEEREAKLLDVMDLAERFWCDHCALINTIKDTQDLLKDLEEPGVDPSVVKQQQETVESFREEIDGLQEELVVVQNLGEELMTACGEPDKPVIKKSVDEVNSAWETLNKTWKERVDMLEEAMQAAVQFQDGLQGMFDWVDILEGKLDSMPPVGTDLETVKQQIEELKEFKGEAYQLQIEMERLNHQAGLLLKKVVEEMDRSAIQEPLAELRMVWDNLDEKIIHRQHKLEGALLALGQFQHALDELLAWLTHTEELLNEQRQASGDPKAIEIELAKHHVLQNDVLAHKSTVEAVSKAGNDLVASSEGEEASGLQSKLENLTQRWKSVLEKTEQRRQLLDNALLQAQGFHGEIEDMQQWLKDTERQLLASKAVGGLPDTAREQLNTHLELCQALEAKEELYQQLMLKGQQLVAMTPEGQDSIMEQDLRNLREKWESVQAKAAERKVKLEEALAMATDFHNSLQDFINWLTQAEQTLTMVSPASLILETIVFQIDEHKVFVTEVNSHRDQIIELDKTGTHLKYFSQKQDVVLIKNLLLSVQGRWEKVVQRSVERGRLLDDARKRAKQFHESWNKLTEWLEESEKLLDSELEIANDPDKIKLQLAQHKEFQKVLGSKHSVYDTTTRTGRALKDKTALQDDTQKLDDMLSELRDKWDTVCGKSVERQNKLEEALLFSGQFTDALQALIDWLYKVEPQLAEDQPVHGDIDLVLNLIDSHKVFQKELGKRTCSVQALKRSARELVENRHDDSSWVRVQMQELSTRWETVCALSVSKQTRLEQALCQAEEFHSTVHILLEWLAEAEQSLRFHGSLPDDEEALLALIEQHKEFMKKLEEKRVALNKATSMGEAILTICHPDSITTIKHWNTIIKARFDEVQAWARQHQQRLAGALGELQATQELLESLLGWLQWAETTLNEKDREAIPQEIEEVKALIAEHQAFMEEMTRKQPDVDKVTKTHKRKAPSEAPIQSQIPVLDKGRAARNKTQAMYPAGNQTHIETKNPRVNLLISKWQQVWLLALERRRKLNDDLDRLEELKEFANFDFDVWRKRYMRWMNHKKSRVMDFFRRIDKDQDGKVTRQEFIEGILSSKFPTSRLEMSAVADIFDRDGDGYIDYYEFVAALHPNKEAYKPLTDADKIEDEVTRQVAKCKCPKRFQVEQIGANKYRFYLGNQFGDSQQLRLVRILRSTVMVRVGGGWMALDEFLVKNDPCRVHHHGSKMLRSESNSSITQSPIAKGRTNMELREKFILPEGTTQVMASFRYRGRRSRPSSRAASPNRSNSSHSCPAQHNPAVSGTPKTQHITRNYDKPWLANSKPCTPLKSSDSFESQGSSSESTPIQGSKLRLPGYLSGKSFQSAEEGTLINAAVLKARSQAFDSKKGSSRPGSKAGSRGSSRRGSDASDFDISDIQSVCSDASETVTDGSRATPRPAGRQHAGKPSKIPTPQRRSTPSSKLAKSSRR